MNQTKLQKWEKLIAEHDQLAAQGRADIYDRVKLLSKVFEDPDFLEVMKQKRENANDFLTGKIDLGHPFTNLYHAFKHFPTKLDWRRYSLSELIDKTKQKLLPKKEKEKVKVNVETESHHHSRMRVTVAAHKELEDRFTALEMENQYLKSKLEIADKTINSQQDTIQLLKDKLKQKAG